MSEGNDVANIVLITCPSFISCDQIMAKQMNSLKFGLHQTEYYNKTNWYSRNL